MGLVLFIIVPSPNWLLEFRPEAHNSPIPSMAIIWVAENEIDGMRGVIEDTGMDVTTFASDVFPSWPEVFVPHTYATPSISTYPIELDSCVDVTSARLVASS
jgi:hypothetical protein